MVTAFVLSGGGSLGAAQVGMLQAPAELHRHSIDLNPCHGGKAA